MWNDLPQTESEIIPVGSTVSQATTHAEALLVKIQVLYHVLLLYGEKDYHLIRYIFLKSKLGDLTDDTLRLVLELKSLPG